MMARVISFPIAPSSHYYSRPLNAGVPFFVEGAVGVFCVEYTPNWFLLIPCLLLSDADCSVANRFLKSLNFNNKIYEVSINADTCYQTPKLSVKVTSGNQVFYDGTNYAIHNSLLIDELTEQSEPNNRTEVYLIIDVRPEMQNTKFNFTVQNFPFI